jgi:hypothetical protein
MTLWTKFTVLCCHAGGELPRGVAVAEVPRLAWVAEGVFEGRILTSTADEAGVGRQVGHVITNVATSRTENTGLARRWAKSPSSTPLRLLSTSRATMIVWTRSHLMASASVAVSSTWYREIHRSSSSTISAIDTLLWLVGGDWAIVAGRASLAVKFVFTSRLISVGSSRAWYRISSGSRAIVTDGTFILGESSNRCGAASIAWRTGFAFLFRHQETIRGPSASRTWYRS